jgi:hypothetical protein
LGDSEVLFLSLNTTEGFKILMSTPNRTLSCQEPGGHILRGCSIRKRPRWRLMGRK